jgi:hypothetical protein
MIPFQNIVLQRGDDVDLLISFADAVTGEPIALSELVDVRVAIRSDWASTETDNTGAVWSGSLLTTGVSAYGDSAVLLEIPRAVTLALAQAPKPFVYDVEVLTAAGKTITTQKGYVQIDADVGRP